MELVKLSSISRKKFIHTNQQKISNLFSLKDSIQFYEVIENPILELRVIQGNYYGFDSKFLWILKSPNNDLNCIWLKIHITLVFPLKIK